MELRFFEIYRNPDYLWLLAEGAGASALITTASGLLGFVMALVLAGVRFGKVPVLAQISACYVEFIRNTPLIVQLFFVAFGLPMLLGYQWPFWAHAVLALTLNFSAYFSEILRAGFTTVAVGQREAAKALGLPGWLAFVKIVLPQAVARMFPSINSQFIFLFLTTGVISEIGVRDLTQAGMFIDSRTFRSFEVFFTLTVIYVLLSLSFKFALTQMQHRLFKWQVAR
ncbi:amino acid ABC transporter permease [Cognatishimia sp. SS12]|uniref:amino acid ABC transporter permease n=1 Tax=Cognatishimia sp. SS12 TaxID=2979465 RepID=UPI00232FB809|nr:amino acid ABC transporter permease [Cognatishimia sp. SS12]MDC0739665.1 amino acid ABC transporter permease [Cognatishimia sp. SS12]